jgi:hypothetical protein
MFLSFEVKQPFQLDHSLQVGIVLAKLHDSYFSRPGSAKSKHNNGVFDFEPTDKQSLSSFLNVLFPEQFVVSFQFE